MILFPHLLLDVLHLFITGQDTSVPAAANLVAASYFIFHLSSRLMSLDRSVSRTIGHY